MKQTFLSYQNLSATDKIKVIIVFIFMGSLLVLLGFLVGILLRPRQFHLSLPVQAAPTSLIPVTAPTGLAPTGDCDSSTLILGTTTFEIQNLAPGADGSLAVPGDTSGVAYRLAGTESGTVFVLSPTPQNIAVMSTISIGSPAQVTGLGCNGETYSLSAAQARALDGSVLAGSSGGEISVFFPTVSSGAGFLYTGRRLTEPLALNQPTQVIGSTQPPAVKNTSSAPTVLPTAVVPTPDYSEALAEIGLVSAGKSLLGLSLKIELSIYNFGKLPITLSESNVTLTQPDGTAVALKSSKPGFPAEIQPGETKTVELNFETPSSSAVLKILSVEYDVDGY